MADCAHDLPVVVAVHVAFVQTATVITPRRNRVAAVGEDNRHGKNHQMFAMRGNFFHVSGQVVCIKMVAHDFPFPGLCPQVHDTLWAYC